MSEVVMGGDRSAGKEGVREMANLDKNVLKKHQPAKKTISVIFQFYILIWIFASLHSPQKLFCSEIKRGHMTLQYIPEYVT